MKIIGIVGWKDSGKTHLVSEIIKNLKLKKLKVASIKHAHHEFDIDHKNTDSYIHRQSGSSQIIVSSSKRWAKITELENSNEKKLNELIEQLSYTDIVIVEGFKKENHPKIELIKDGNDNYLFNKISNIKAIISDKKINTELHQFKRNDIELIVNFILNKI
ncbi:MAG: molybdopterin-guanine dinucleotide biosynthesis protein B [Pelagibacteraceae bacterium]|nr:molybdopterin-guanine dinucleotide biosynthesis protein B [Pelagibacteraceae bacterium]|tara:strand:+ start:41145 stop:41627 length:483 start_codon:yes stop_codon:yes gene_type:complete